MPRVRDGQSDFTGGVRSNGSLFDGIDSEVTELINWRIDLSGSLVVRPGSQVIHNALSDLASEVYQWKPTSDDTVLLIATVDGHLYYTTVDPEESGYPLTLADAGDVQSAQFMVGFRDATQEVVYFRSGPSLLLKKFDGSGVTTVGAGTNLGRMVVYNRRLFSFVGSTLYWSDLDNGDTLGDETQGGGRALIRTFGGGDIVGLAVLGSTLFVFHRTSVSRFRGWTIDDIDIESGLSVVSNPVGLANSWAVAAFGGYLYFVGHDAQVYRMTEEGSVEVISNQVRDDIGDELQLSAFVIANPNDREIWVAPSGSTTTWIYNVDRGAWYKFAFAHGSWIWMTEIAARDHDNSPAILGVSSEDGNIYDLRYLAAPRDAVCADGLSGVNLTADFQSRHFTFSDPSLVKSLRFLYLAIDGVSTGVSVFVIDENDNSASLGTIEPTGAVDRFQAWGKFKAPRVRLTYSGGGFPVLSDVYLDAFVYNRPT